MKSLTIFCFFLLAVFGAKAQETELTASPEKKPELSVLEIGPGVNLDPDKTGFMKVELTAAASRVLAMWVDGRVGFDKSSTQFYQVGVKAGPYMRVGKYGYVSLAGGLAFFMSSFSESGFNVGTQPNSYVPFLNDLSYKRTLVTAPIQVKLSVPLYRRLGFGAELCHHLCLTKSVDDWAFCSFFISWQLKNN